MYSLAEIDFDLAILRGMVHELARRMEAGQKVTDEEFIEIDVRLRGLRHALRSHRGNPQ